jgi:RNA polymerase sigma-70 factor (ECF subfamily)
MGSILSFLILMISMNIALKFKQHQLFADLYQAHYAWLYHWLLKKLRQNEQAEDVAQDTFMRILYAQNFENITHPKSYLAQTATRIIIDQARRKQIEQAYLDYLTAQDQQYEIETPESILLAVELLERVARMLDGLPEQPRQIFLMRYLEGLTQLQIAEQLNISRRMVQGALAKAIQHCDQILQHD